MFSVTLVRAQIVQPPEPVDPSPINGEMYYLINQLSGLQIDLNNNSTTPGDNILVNGRSFTNLSQRWALTKALSGNWKISNILDGLCLDSVVQQDITYTMQNPCGINVPSQEWSFTYVKNGFNVVTNVGTKLILDASNTSLGNSVACNSLMSMSISLIGAGGIHPSAKRAETGRLQFERQ
jgi:Ricin-type beta-trefoil lectin domain